MNIFLSFFRRSKMDEALAKRVDELEAHLRQQSAENQRIYSKLTAMQKELAASNAKVNKFQVSNTRLQSRVLKLHLEVKASGQAGENFAADLSKAVKESALRYINEIGKPVIASMYPLELPPMKETAERGFTYEPSGAMPAVRWLDQTRHTVADYYAGHLPHWAAKYVTQQSLTYRVSKLAADSLIPVNPVSVKTAARTMARSWPMWLLEKAAAWITLNKGGIVPPKENGFLRQGPGGL